MDLGAFGGDAIVVHTEKFGGLQEHQRTRPNVSIAIYVHSIFMQRLLMFFAKSIDGDVFVLKRMLLEKGEHVRRAGLREIYFNEVLRNNVGLQGRIARFVEAFITVRTSYVRRSSQVFLHEWSTYEKL